jgi:hypothetical protein
MMRTEPLVSVVLLVGIFLGLGMVSPLGAGAAGTAWTSPPQQSQQLLWWNAPRSRSHKDGLQQVSQVLQVLQVWHVGWQQVSRTWRARPQQA